MHSHRKGFTLVEMLVVVGVIAVVAVLFVSVPVCSQRASNERNATTSLKTLVYAEMDFRHNDRDWNGVNDYWTGDVRGLYTMTAAVVRGAEPNSTSDPSIKLIELSVACADADDTFVSAGGENLPLSNFGTPSPKAGYWYAALKSDRSTGITYRQDTRGYPRMGLVHHETKFGFIAFPDSTSAGKYAFMVNEAGTILRTALTAPLRVGTESPPGLDTIPGAFLNWPDDASSKATWAPLD